MTEELPCSLSRNNILESQETRHLISAMLKEIILCGHMVSQMTYFNCCPRVIVIVSVASRQALSSWTHPRNAGNNESVLAARNLRGRGSYGIFISVPFARIRFSHHSLFDFYRDHVAVEGFEIFSFHEN